MKRLHFLFILVFSVFWIHSQEKQQPDLMHNPQLYFSRLPRQAQHFLNECIYHYIFNVDVTRLGPFFTRFSPTTFAKILQQIEFFPLLDARFLNNKDKVNYLLRILFAANHSKQITYSDILLKLHTLLPDAPTPEISKDVIHSLLIRNYNPEEIASGIRENHFKMAQEYLDRMEAQRICKLYLPAGEIATWKLRQLMKPTFDQEHRAPYDIHISRKKDARIAPQVAHLLSEGAYVNAYCYSHYSLLVCAATWRMPQVVELLLNAGADPNEGLALWFAKGARVTKLLLAAGADPNVKSRDGRTAIFPDPSWASYSSVAKMRLLLQAGADPNIDRSHRGSPGTPLIACLCRLKKPKNTIPLIEELLAGGADRTMRVNYLDEQKTAEDLARSCGMDDVVQLLTKPRKIA